MVANTHISHIVRVSQVAKGWHRQREENKMTYTLTGMRIGNDRGQYKDRGQPTLCNLDIRVAVTHLGLQIYAWVNYSPIFVSHRQFFYVEKLQIK
jgi:hypothetical protein